MDSAKAEAEREAPADSALAAVDKDPAKEEQESDVSRSVTTTTTTTTTTKRRIPFPNRVFLIVFNEFFERNAYYGLRSILYLYFTNELLWSPNDSIAGVHAFVMLVYLTPILGSIVADQFLGKYRAIVYLSLVYILGLVLKSIAPIPETSDIGAVPLSVTGLVLVAVGSGGVKPSIIAFGRDQFVLPQQEKQLPTFFSIVYFAVNAGALLSVVLTPSLRKDVQCFGEHTCYSVAFAVSGLYMALATITLVCGQRLYVSRDPEGNVLLMVVKSVSYALRKKLTSRKKEAAPVEHWMDHARDRFGPRLVEDVKGLLSVTYLYLPLPFFWALLDQQCTTWAAQAVNMTGELGDVVIKPDQIQALNAAFVIVFSPVFDAVVYPLLTRLSVPHRPLQRMAAGGLLLAVAFVAAGLLEMKVARTFGRLPATNRSQLNAMNAMRCDVVLSFDGGSRTDEIAIASGHNRVVYDLEPGKYSVRVASAPGCSGDLDTSSIEINILDREVHGVVVTPNHRLVDLAGKEDPSKDGEGDDKFSFYILREGNGAANSSKLSNLTLKLDNGVDPHHAAATYLADGIYYAGYLMLYPGSWDLILNDKRLGELVAHLGGVHAVVVFADDAFSAFTLTNSSSVHLLWQLPQYAVLSAGEVLFSITGLEFFYNQAPGSMRSVALVFWLLNVTFGNLIVILVYRIFDFGDYEKHKAFFLFAGLLAADMLAFSVMAHFYKYRKLVGKKELEQQEPVRTEGDVEGFAEAINF